MQHQTADDDDVAIVAAVMAKLLERARSQKVGLLEW